jgi:hypothetical protein
VQEKTVTLSLANGADASVAHLYISPSESDDWGEDWLDDYPLEAGQQIDIPGLPPDSYDIMVTDEEDVPWTTLFHVDLSEDQTITLIGQVDVPAEATSLIDEVFEGNSLNWPTGQVEGGPVRRSEPANDDYCFNMQRSGWAGWSWVPSPDDTASDLTLDNLVMQALCTADDPEASCALLVGANEDAYYWLQVVPATQRYSVSRWQEGEWQDRLVDWDTSHYIAPYGANYIGIAWSNEVLTVIINGVPVGSSSADHFTKVGLGIGMGTFETDEAQVCFHRLQVWELPGGIDIGP